jgi:hypothetical protein
MRPTGARIVPISRQLAGFWTRQDTQNLVWGLYDFARGAPLFRGRGHHPGSLYRALYRFTALAVAAVLTAQHQLSRDVVDPGVLTRTAWAVWAAAWVVLAVLGYKAVDWWRLRYFRREVIKPLHEELCPVLWKCRPQDKRPSEYIHATLDLAHDQAGVRIAFPAGVVGNEGLQRQVETIVLRKLRYSPDDVIAAPAGARSTSPTPPSARSSPTPPTPVPSSRSAPPRPTANPPSSRSRSTRKPPTSPSRPAPASASPP